MYIKDDNLFKKCLGEINMDDKVKKDIEATERLLSAEETIMAYYGSEEEQRKREKWRMQNAITEATKEALQQNKNEIAKNMLAKNMPTDLIIELTNLTKEEIEALK